MENLDPTKDEITELYAWIAMKDGKEGIAALGPMALVASNFDLLNAMTDKLDSVAEIKGAKFKLVRFKKAEESNGS